MTHIAIVLKEPTFKTLLVYYWHQLPAHEYAVVFAGLFLLQGLAEIFSLAVGFRFAIFRHPHALINTVLSAAYVLSGCMAGYTLLLVDSPCRETYWTGLGVFVCAYIGRDLTRSLLKPKYSSYLEMIINERSIISGIFALIRHPLSALYLLEMVAFPLIAWNNISAATLAIACLGVLWKIQREEHRLTLQFKEYFPAYRRTTKRIIPFVY